MNIDLTACKQFWTPEQFRKLMECNPVAAHDLGGLIHDCQKQAAEIEQLEELLRQATKWVPRPSALSTMIAKELKGQDNEE